MTVKTAGDMSSPGTPGHTVARLFHSRAALTQAARSRGPCEDISPVVMVVPIC